MSELVIVTFDEELKAEEVRLNLLKMQSDHLVVLEDAVVLVRTKEGKVKLRHDSHHPFGGALAGGVLGALVGLMLLNPVFAILGAAAGTTMGAVSGSRTHLGVDEDFMKTLADHLKPGTSALCVLVEEALDSVLQELEKFHGKVLQTSLAEGYEAKLQAAIDSLEADKSA